MDLKEGWACAGSLASTAYCAEEGFHGSWGPNGGREQLGDQRKLPQKMQGVEKMAVGTHIYTDTHT